MTKVAMYDVEGSFSQYVAQAVSGIPVEVTSSGKPVFYIVGAEYFMRINHAGKTGFSSAYDSWRKKFSSSEEEFPFDNMKRDDALSRGTEWLNEN